MYTQIVCGVIGKSPNIVCPCTVHVNVNGTNVGMVRFPDMVMAGCEITTVIGPFIVGHSLLW